MKCLIGLEEKKGTGKRDIETAEDMARLVIMGIKQVRAVEAAMENDLLLPLPAL